MPLYKCVRMYVCICVYMCMCTWGGGGRLYVYICVYMCVDMLRSNHGPVIMEVNSSPGLRGIEAASEKDIAQLIIQFIEKRFESMSTAKDKSPTRTRTRGKG